MTLPPAFRIRAFASALVFCSTVVAALPGQLTAQKAVIGEAELARLISDHDWDAIRGLGPEVMPVLVRMYESSDADGREAIARTFYVLRWESAEAKSVLMQDIRTTHEGLRLQVQWALGRVSGDDDVVESLLRILQEDPNPLFRDKAGCGLAYDQIHLTEAQKVGLYSRLIDLLDSPSLETRRLAIRILAVHTGQTKGYHTHLPPELQQESLGRWHRWLDEYRSHW